MGKQGIRIRNRYPGFPQLHVAERSVHIPARNGENNFIDPSHIEGVETWGVMAEDDLIENPSAIGSYGYYRVALVRQCASGIGACDERDFAIGALQVEDSLAWNLVCDQTSFR